MGGPDEFEALLDAIRNANKDDEDDDIAVKEKACPLDDYECESFSKGHKMIQGTMYTLLQ